MTNIDRKVIFDLFVARNGQEWTRNGQENYFWKIPVYYWAFLTKT